MKILVMISYFITLLASMGYVLVIIVKNGFTFLSISVMIIVASAVSILAMALENFDKTKTNQK